MDLGDYKHILGLQSTDIYTRGNRQDYGKDFIANVPKYDGHCCVPSHLDYRPVIGSFKNKYSPLRHIPTAGEWHCIESLVRHIFGDQYELGLDYLQILYTIRCRNSRFCCWYQRNATLVN